MTPRRPRALRALLPLLICSTACIKVPVEQPQPPCPIPDVPAFPVLHAIPCPGPNNDPRVCLTPADTVALWAWIRAEERALEMAQVCLDEQDAPGGSAAQ